jgi:hypothetical protein
MPTEVELLFHPGLIERWIRFGRWTEERILDRRRRMVGFAPGAVFGLVRWQSGDYGTVVSRLDIVRAVAPGEPFTTLPAVTPGGELYAHLSGWPKVEAALQAIDAVEAAGVDPRHACPDHWRHVASRIEAGQPPRAYSLARHRAWRLRREALS